MVQWVLETWGLPLAFTWDKELWRQEQIGWWSALFSYPLWQMKESCKLWKSNYHRGKKCGVRNKNNNKKIKPGEKQTREQLLLQARRKEGIVCMGVFACYRVGSVVRPQAAHGTMGTTAKSERGGRLLLFLREEDTVILLRERKRCLTGLRREGWRWRRICVNVSVPHKPQFPLALIPELPKGQCSTDERQGRYRSTVKH